MFYKQENTKPLPAKRCKQDKIEFTLQCARLICKFTKTSICVCLSPHSLQLSKFRLQSLLYYEFLEIIFFKINFHIYSFLRKCQEGRFPRIIYVSQNKLLCTSEYILYQITWRRPWTVSWTTTFVRFYINWKMISQVDCLPSTFNSCFKWS